MAKSYFAILGVSSKATTEEIRSAFRRLAKEFHPDHFRGGSGPFREIQEAYAVIGDPQRRHRYQQSLESSRSIRRPPRPPAAPEPEPLVPEQCPLDLGEISLVRSFQRVTPSFDEVFSWLWENFSSMDWPKSGRVQDLTLEVPLTPEQALRGGIARVMVPARAVCPICRGQGGLGAYECTRCAGEGAITGELPVSISYPAGLTSDHAVMVPLTRFGIRNLHLTVLLRVQSNLVR